MAVNLIAADMYAGKSAVYYVDFSSNPSQGSIKCLINDAAGDNDSLQKYRSVGLQSNFGVVKAIETHTKDLACTSFKLSDTNTTRYKIFFIWTKRLQEAQKDSDDINALWVVKDLGIAVEPGKPISALVSPRASDRDLTVKCFYYPENNPNQLWVATNDGNQNTPYALSCVA